MQCKIYHCVPSKVVDESNLNETGDRHEHDDAGKCGREGQKGNAHGAHGYVKLLMTILPIDEDNTQVGDATKCNHEKGVPLLILHLTQTRGETAVFQHETGGEPDGGNQDSVNVPEERLTTVFVIKYARDIHHQGNSHDYPGLAASQFRDPIKNDVYEK